MKLHRVFFCLTLPVLLMGCDSPSPKFMDSPRLETTVGGSTFAIYVLGDQVEALRISPQRRPRLNLILSNGKIAVEQVTGCKVVPNSLKGDHAMFTAEIDCS